MIHLTQLFITEPLENVRKPDVFTVGIEMKHFKIETDILKKVNFSEHLEKSKAVLFCYLALVLRDLTCSNLLYVLCYSPSQNFLQGNSFSQLKWWDFISTLDIYILV